MVARSAAAPTHKVLIAGVPVLATVTARPAIARRWVCSTLWRCRRLLLSGSGRLTVGLRVQWTPTFRALPGGAEPRPGTLQLCAGQRCLVFQVARAGHVPAALRRLLADTRATFAGYNVGSDCRKLLAHHGLRAASTLELRGAGNAPLERMETRLLGIRGGGMKKSSKVSTSTWDGVTLSKKQVRYACVDAYLSCRLGVHLGAAMASQPSDSDSD
ncbi:hypothetical protein BS78_03G166100 [Paspalum vaginatum]|nr:hypothetical protein BS78_03G166100 [Paspalum vaginatum]